VTPDVAPIDLDQASGLLLGIAGGVLQFAMRQFSGVKDRWYILVAVGLTFLCFALVVRNWPRPDWRDSAIVMVLWIAGHLTAVAGGTFLTSMSAHAAADHSNAKAATRDPGGSADAAATNIMMPVTNSK
jgi:hypothetical protein